MCKHLTERTFAFQLPGRKSPLPLQKPLPHSIGWSKLLSLDSVATQICLDCHQCRPDGCCVVWAILLRIAAVDVSS